jgi:hypothetical protein
MLLILKVKIIYLVILVATMTNQKVEVWEVLQRQLDTNM